MDSNHRPPRPRQAGKAKPHADRAVSLCQRLMRYACKQKCDLVARMAHTEGVEPATPWSTTRRTQARTPVCWLRTDLSWPQGKRAHCSPTRTRSWISRVISQRANSHVLLAPRLPGTSIGRNSTPERCTGCG